MHYTQVLLPHIVKYCSAHWDSQHSYQIIVFLATLLTSDVLKLTPGMVAATVDEHGLIKFPVKKPASNKKYATKGSKDEQERLVDGILRLLTGHCNWSSEAHLLSRVIMKDEENTATSRIALVTAVLSIVPHVSLPSDTAAEAVLTLLRSLLEALSKEDQSITLQKREFVQGSAMATLHILLGEAIEILAVLSERAGQAGVKLLAGQWDMVMKDALHNYGSNEVVLRGVAKYCTVLKQRYWMHPSYDHDQPPWSYILISIMTWHIFLAVQRTICSPQKLYVSFTPGWKKISTRFSTGGDYTPSKFSPVSK